MGFTLPVEPPSYVDADTFTWRVNSDSSGGGQISVAKAQFGDGYQQIATVGLNPDVQKWTVVFSGYKAEAQAVLDFIRAHAGRSFYWTPPLGSLGFYTCAKYTPAAQGGSYYTLTLEFEQVFFP